MKLFATYQIDGRVTIKIEWFFFLNYGWERESSYVKRRIVGYTTASYHAEFYYQFSYCFNHSNKHLQSISTIDRKTTRCIWMHWEKEKSFEQFFHKNSIRNGEWRFPSKWFQYNSFQNRFFWWFSFVFISFFSLPNKRVHKHISNEPQPKNCAKYSWNTLHMRKMANILWPSRTSFADIWDFFLNQILIR